jgi:BirA family transcriptional regulator, biotin operon repressor / biotin---[acetyl-CoA-carboxylase] ligase
MKIIHLKKVESTHIYLKEFIDDFGYATPLCFFSTNQLHGIGSRGDIWKSLEGNLFFSFVIHKKELPIDIPLQSLSIYFSFIFKSILNSKGSSIWLKWPNDFYINDKKVGGTLTNVVKDLVYCGIGLNLYKVSNEFGFLDINIDKKEVLELYFLKLSKNIFWKEIFREYKIEFETSKMFYTTYLNKKISLKDTSLNEDGSISFNDKKVYSIR